jgi:hypothetical protein
MFSILILQNFTSSNNSSIKITTMKSQIHELKNLKTKFMSKTTIKFSKVAIAICILCFMLIGTTSCSKSKVNPTSATDERLIGKWEKQDFLGNNVSVIQEVFNADGTGFERRFRLDDGSTQISNETITNFTWSAKSNGVISLKVNGEEGDVQFFITESGDALRLTLPSGDQLILGRVN